MTCHHSLQQTLQDGEVYAGLMLGKGGAPDHHLVLLAGDIDDATWTAARDWAKGMGGDLPNRRELSLLHANLKEMFLRVWYWSAEQSEARSQLVWGQNFSSGIQTMYGRQFHGRACAVRRIPCPPPPSAVASATAADPQTAPSIDPAI